MLNLRTDIRSRLFFFFSRVFRVAVVWASLSVFVGALEFVVVWVFWSLGVSALRLFVVLVLRFLRIWGSWEFRIFDVEVVGGELFFDGAESCFLGRFMVYW